MPDGRFTREERALLLDVAVDSIRTAFPRRSHRLPSELPAALVRPASVFVTLHVDGDLNGCVGSVEGSEPLATAVARLARSAAFDDPRLPRLRRDQLEDCAISISVLSPLEPIRARTRADVLASLQPGRHGLVLQWRAHRALFLPDVWGTLPEGEVFLDQLLAKAGLRPGTWPEGIAAHRFTTEVWHR